MLHQLGQEKVTSGLCLSIASSPLFYCVFRRQFKGINSIFQAGFASGMVFCSAGFIGGKKSSVDALSTCQGVGSAWGFRKALTLSPSVLLSWAGGWNKTGVSQQQGNEGCCSQRLPGDLQPQHPQIRGVIKSAAPPLHHSHG